MKLSYKIKLALTIIGFSSAVYNANSAEEDLTNLSLEDLMLVNVSIIGSPEKINTIAGSAYFIGSVKLQEFSYTDIQRIIREVPGISVQLEDGFGLRPNISMRGVATERSGRITLLEDNVLIAPAPYSAPAAYYFPTAGRFQAIEVVKGPAAITQGPYTIGGAINMISTSIPNDSSGSFLVEAGQNATYRAHGTYGGFNDQGLGFLVETHQWSSNGFQDIDRSNNDTGLNVEDYMLKLAYAPKASKHRIELKAQLSNQDSNQSYLGLIDADFTNTPYRRYGISALDNIHVAHKQLILRYEFQLSDALQLSALAYNNDMSRNWFKTEGIDLNGSINADDINRISWSTIINDINFGNSRDGFSAEQLHNILQGSLSTAPGSIDMRSNNREYFSRGLQFGLNLELQSGTAQHNLHAGLRFHRDEEDRLEYDSSYQQLDGQLVLNDIGILGAAGNRIQQAEAVSLHLYDEISIGRWMLAPGLRYENIDQTRTNYLPGLERDVLNTRQNHTSIWLPGIGVNYTLNNELSLLGGVHKGFTAPTNAPGVDPEEAINYELGFRYNTDTTRIELIGFISDYSNLLGVCTSSSGADCEIGNAFNGDAIMVRGFELLSSTSFPLSLQVDIPLVFSYTFTNGKFETDITSTAFFGSVTKGSPLPYIPKNQFHISTGLEGINWGLNFSVSYIDAVCVKASCGEFEKTDNSITLDIAANFQLTDFVNIYGRVVNLSSQDGIAGRHPYGARPNMSKTATLGLRVTF